MRVNALLSLCFSATYFQSYCHVATQCSCGFRSPMFRKIVSTSTFVDKSFFIKAFIINNKTSLVTAPPGFGKSTNLDMLKNFLEIEVNDKGQPITKSDYMMHPVKDTPNYKLFNDHNLKITKEISVFDEYFGRSPVMRVSFNCAKPIRSFADTLKFLRDMVHSAFKQHLYLSKSQYLSEAEREYFSIWANDQDYLKFGKESVTSSLKELVYFLFRHFGDRRVFVMVDDHDSLTKSAMLNVASNDVLDKIVQTTVSMLYYVLKNNDKYVWGSLITGVTLIPVLNSTKHSFINSEDFEVYRFLDNHPFNDFYGLSKEEVDSLIVNTGLNLADLSAEDDIQTQYNGYRTKCGKRIYNLYSILKFLENMEIKNYWTGLNKIPNFSDVLKVSAVNNAVETLLRGNTLNVDRIEEIFTFSDVLDYRNILLRPEQQSVSVVMKFFNLLLEEGYLTPAESDKQKNAVIIPNDEIKSAFIQNSRNYKILYG